MMACAGVPLAPQVLVTPTDLPPLNVPVNCCSVNCGKEWLVHNVVVAYNGTSQAGCQAPYRGVGGESKMSQARISALKQLLGQEPHVTLLTFDLRNGES